MKPRGVRRGKVVSAQAKNKLLGYLLFFPSGAILIAIVLWPLIWALITSFSTYTFVFPVWDTFVWFDNFLEALKDQYFLNSLYVICKFVVCVVFLEFFLGFVIAFLLSRDIKFKVVFYTILAIPMVMAPVAVALMWRMFLHTELGIANYLIRTVGFTPVNWLGSSKTAFWTVLMVDIWHQISFMILILLAGFVSLPKEPYEAAAIDGASGLQRLIYITFPLMKPVIVIALLLRTIFAFKTFDLIYVLTRGGPGVSTDVLSYYIYRVTFSSLNLAGGCAQSYLFLAIVMTVAVFLFRAMRGTQI